MLQGIDDKFRDDQAQALGVAAGRNCALGKHLEVRRWQAACLYKIDHG
jgi:hypothetical protein